MHVIAAKAVAFGEALKPEFKTYISNVIENAKIIATTLMERDIDIITNGTDNHIVLVDLRSKGVTGKATESALTSCNITCNKNAVPFDDQSPFITSGIRLGSPACTSRNFSQEDFKTIANLIADTIDNLSKDNQIKDEFILNTKKIVKEICDNRKF